MQTIATDKYLDVIRRVTDSERRYFEDDEIYAILRITHNDLNRSIERVLLGVLARSQNAKDAAMVNLARTNLRLHEAGLLLQRYKIEQGQV